MRFYLISALLLFATAAQAQDVLHKTDNTQTQVKIEEISDTQIKYRMHSNPTGPLYVISKEDVVRIVYQSGQVEIIPKTARTPMPYTPSEPVRTYNNRSVDFGRNFISINIPDFLFESLTLNYEHIFPTGYYSLKVPVSIGLGSDNRNNSYGYYMPGYYNRNKVFSTGLDFYFYPFGQGEAKFFFGPSLEYGRIRPWVYHYDHMGYTSSRRQVDGNFRSFLLQTGYLFQPTKNFNMSVQLGLGYTNVELDQYVPNHYGYDYHNSNGQPALRGAMNMGYKF